MDIDKMDLEMKYVEANGCCLNIDEKMKLSFAIDELSMDLGLTGGVALVAKVTGKLLV